MRHPKARSLGSLFPCGDSKLILHPALPLVPPSLRPLCSLPSPPLFLNSLFLSLALSYIHSFRLQTCITLRRIHTPPSSSLPPPPPPPTHHDPFESNRALRTRLNAMSSSHPSSFGPGSIFYDGPLTPARLHHDQSPTRDKKHARPPGVSGVSLNALASPPPSPSRNTIFDMPWSGSAPNISSLRAATTFPNTTSTATTATQLTDTVSISTESLPPSPLPSSVESIGRAGSLSGYHGKPAGYSSRIHLHNNKGRTSSDMELAADGIERCSRLTGKILPALEWR